MIMKKYGLITKVLLISMFAILLNGCGNLLTSEFSSKTNEAKFYTITGNIDVDAHSAKNSTRTGLPTIPSINDNSINFSVSAKMGDKTITGEVSEMQYSITLPKGSWTITVIGKKAEVKVLEGSINVNPEEVTTQQTITLKTIKNEGTGSLSLTITKDSELSCGGVKATLYKNSGEESNDVKYLKFTTTDNSTKWEVKDLNAGTYSIDLDFYQKMTLNADGTYSCENLLYSHHDTVNIFANFATNTWTGSGYSEDKTTFTLTKAMITNFAMTTFYVSNSGDDSKAGTYFAPFATLQAAVNKVIEMNNVSSSSENAPYRILLLSGVTDTSTGEDIDTNDGSLISIKNYSNPKLYLKIASYQNDSCFEIKGASGRRIMNIQEDANVTIENITLTGGNINANGGGVYVANKAIFTMGNGATISNCTGDNGGGVYVQSGIFIMNSGAKINGCKAEGEYAGGGVYLNGGTFTMNGGTISGCTAEQGGGVCIFGGELIMNEGATISTCTSLLYGGGVVVYGSEGVNSGAGGTFNMAGGTISGCSAEQGGAGVCVQGGTFTMENKSLISKNTSGGNGGGIFADGGSITIKGGSISENIFENEYSGGGIYLTNSATLEMSSGKISGNCPQNTDPSNGTNGGGVMVSEATFTMTGGEILGNSAYYGGGVAVDGSFFMSGGTISGNKVTNNSNGNGSGSGVYVAYSGNSQLAATFEMSGGAVISSGNDVYLAKEASIKVTGNLTGTTPVATITPDKYSATWQVITVPVSADGTTSSVTLSDQVGKFAVTSQVEETTEETINWTINANGFLSKETVYYVGNNENDNPLGTETSPFATLQAAVDEVNSINDGTSSYTIYVMCDITWEEDSSGTTSSAFINIAPEKSLKLKICGYGDNIEIDAQQKGSVMYIANNDNSYTAKTIITLENVTLTGGKSTGAGGVTVFTGGELIMNSGATIKNCTGDYAGGIIIYTGGTFTMNDKSTISECTSLSYGGGVVVCGSGSGDSGAGGTFNMAGGTISGCIAEYGCGGGVYVEKGTFTMNGGVIGKEISEDDSSKTHSWEYAADADNHSNYASDGGGGIYVADGTVTISGGKISYNYVPNFANDCGGNAPSNTACGGGISVVKGNLTINNAEVSYNSGYQGGGIRCYNDNTSNAGTLTLNETLIKGNTSNPYKGSSFGGGLMVKNFTVKFEGDTPSVIEENFSGDGGALFLEYTTSTLKNITIQNNSYNSDGYHYGSEVLLWAKANVSIGSSNVTIESAEGETRGIFMNNDVSKPNTLNLFGDAKLDAPIYLTNGAMVTVSGALTESTVATITPASYAEDTQVLKAGSGVTLSDNIVGRFAVMPSSDGIKWSIDANGYLKKQE